MVLFVLLNQYIQLRRRLNVYMAELAAVNSSSATQKKSDVVQTSCPHQQHYTACQSPTGLTRDEMLNLEKELQSLHQLSANTPSNAHTQQHTVTPNTAPKEVEVRENDENNSLMIDAENVTPKVRTGRFAYGNANGASSVKKVNVANTIKTTGGGLTSKSGNGTVLGSINTNSNVRTEPRRWRVNQKPVETLSTDEVAVALLSKFS